MKLFALLHFFCGRLDTETPIYQAEVPSHWHQVEIVKSLDTTMPIAQFCVGKGENLTTITLHNFPIKEIEESVSYRAQINRWCTQQSLDNPYDYSITPESHDGFYGAILESDRIIAASYQIDQGHFRTLNRIHQNQEQTADWTIKAEGKLLEEQSPFILSFIHSFTLCEEISGD